jgi:hypothetical protein
MRFMYSSESKPLAVSRAAGTNKPNPAKRRSKTYDPPVAGERTLAHENARLLVCRRAFLCFCLLLYLFGLALFGCFDRRRPRSFHRFDDRSVADSLGRDVDLYDLTVDHSANPLDVGFELAFGFSSDFPTDTAKPFSLTTVSVSSSGSRFFSRKGAYARHFVLQ